MPTNYPLRLGLLTTARVNERIIAGAAASDTVDVVAVASRSEARAVDYARRHGIQRAYGSYTALLEAPDVDAIHVSLPNALHVEWTLAALRAGKHVLVEKPFTQSAEEAERCFDAAERAGLVLNEALMWRHLPQTQRLVERVQAGEIGDVRLIRASYSSPVEQRGDWRWDRQLQGGALMDFGCYCVSAIRLLAGEPSAVAAHAVVAPSGVDARLAATLQLADGVLGLFDCAFDLQRRRTLEVVGSRGMLAAPNAWYPTEGPGLELTAADGRQEIEEPESRNPYQLELKDFAAAIATHRPTLLGRADGVAQAATLGAIAAAAGL